MKHCDRCHKPMSVYTMSWFNTDNICEECEEKENNHPDLGYAKQIESEECRKGTLNFEGVGWPGLDGRVAR